MLVMRPQKFDILADAVFLLSEIANEADVKFTQPLFALIASNPSLGFIATIKMRREFFRSYSVDQYHSSRISLHAFHSAMWDVGTFSEVVIFVTDDKATMNLTFQAPVILRDRPLVMHRELILSPSQDENYLGDISEFKKCFSIDVQNFRRIIREVVPFQNDSICVTLTNSQVKFSIASVEIILTQARGQCEIEGGEGEVIETQFRISLHPKSFFLKMTYQAAEDRIEFYKTTTAGSYSVIFIPTYRTHADYMIYFPQM